MQSTQERHHAMNRHPPPPVLDSARVLAYAFVDDIPYRRWGSLYVGDELLEHVPRLAICMNLGQDLGPLLFHCDPTWTVLGTSGAVTVAETKGMAERNYPGAASRWVDLNTGVDAALAYYDVLTGACKCAVCGKRPFDIERWSERQDADICANCAEKNHHG
jgi:hypothetical protein